MFGVRNENIRLSLCKNSKGNCRTKNKGVPELMQYGTKSFNQEPQSQEDCTKVKPKDLQTVTINLVFLQNT